MSNGLTMALASEDHFRYFKAQKASEGKRFHELDSQSHIEKHQKLTDPTKMLDFLTSQYPQNLILSIILRSSKKQQIPNAYSRGTQTERLFYIVFQCVLFWKKANISLSVTLNLKRFALYQCLVYKSARRRRHSIDIISSMSDLPTKKTIFSVGRAPLLESNYADRKRRSSSPWH